MTADDRPDERTALALASLRITRGNPTAEEVAAIAVLLMTRLRLLDEAQAEQDSTARVLKLPVHRSPAFVAPGAWAS